MNSKVGANILGVHLEGPFISEDFIGAQNPKYVSNPNVKLFEEINNEGKTILIVTHEDDIAHMCKRIVNLKDGVIISDSKVEQVLVKSLANV